MRTFKILTLFLFSMTLLMSCAESKEFKNNKGESFTVEPFGWANEKSLKNDSIIYQINAGNIVLSVIFSETVFVPVVLTGWYFYEPVRIKEISETPQKTDYTGIIIAGVILLFLYGTWWSKRE